jgi:UDP-N-acetylglucosamine 1-carboxyvinyltransferase
MDRIRIRGGRPLCGQIVIGGAKNAALPLMAAGLLTDERVVLSNVPFLADIRTMAALLAQHGIAVDRPAGGAGENEATGAGDAARRTLSIGGPITSTEAPYDIVREMRASVLVLGPLLARMGEAKVSLPGGCAIGIRPIDLHLRGLEQMGAQIRLVSGYVHASAPRGLRGACIVMPFPSVGATENLLMAASLADGQTILSNAAREPEITDLCDCLVAMGARIDGIGSGKLIVEGVKSLHGTTHPIISDRIETGSYACAAAITGGAVHLRHGRLDHLGAVVRVLNEAGVEVTEDAEGLAVKRLNGLRGVDFLTEPYPGFPTDMQAQLMALMCVAEGASMVTENIFENRFSHVAELNRMGGNINVHGASAIVRGVPALSGAPVMASDLRASFGLILAGLAANGETIVDRVYHLDRGYETAERKLAAVGADIERLTG